jgi:hypothetical protein
LRNTQADWKASEKVIEEQTATENALTVQGKDLQEDVLSRRDDIIRLLDKVAR